MCAFSFVVFVSAFQLFPTAPYRILELGGSTWAAGAFLGLLTYASALSAPLTGAVADRVGKGRMMAVCGAALAAFSAAYALAPNVPSLLALVVVHGFFWSGLLSASAAYMADFIPESRRAEGIGYWGLATVAAIAAAPSIGFAVYQRGWAALCALTGALNLGMVAIALRLPEAVRPEPSSRLWLLSPRIVEWRVALLSITLFLYSFGYGGITSFVALYADENHVTPRGLYFTTFAAFTLLVRIVSGPLADRLGYRRVFLPCLGLIAAGYFLLAVASDRTGFVISAAVFGSGFGAAWPVFAAHVLRHVGADRRGAAFGGILAAFDTGIGTGSIVTGWVVGRLGFGAAYGLAGALATLSLPYFLFAEKRLFGGRALRSASHPTPLAG